MLSVVAPLLQVLPVGSLEIKVKAAPSQKVAMSIATFTVMPCALKSASVLFTLIVGTTGLVTSRLASCSQVPESVITV